MCLAIPGKIVELLAGSATGALVEVIGVRRKIDLGLLADDMRSLLRVPAVGQRIGSSRTPGTKKKASPALSARLGCWRPAASLPSRGWEVITSPATRRTPVPLRRYASGSSGKRSRSLSCRGVLRLAAAARRTHWWPWRSEAG